MKHIGVVYFIYSLVILVVVNGRKLNSAKILSDGFINEINSAQSLWKADRTFHKDSELRNLISIDFKRQFSLENRVIEPNNSIPSSFDLRKYWPLCVSIGNVKDQGNCASSHAIVAASVFTDRLCIQKGILRTTSADQILTCCKKCGGGCFGGHIENAFNYIKRVGAVSGGGYGSSIGCRPYNIKSCPKVQGKFPLCSRIRSQTPSCYFWKCKNNHIKYDSDKLKIKDIYALPPNSDAIKSEIMNNGSVSATFTIYEDFFNYKSGVYFHTLGDRVGEFDVKIIGWGKTKETPYWLAVNSWGTIWGDQGTFKIKSGSNECNIESHILAGTFYDLLG